MIMTETQQKRLEDVVKKINEYEPAADEVEADKVPELVDMFNDITLQAVARLNVIKEMFYTTTGLPENTPEDFIKYEAGRLEEITRTQVNELCDCLLAFVACRKENNATKIREAC